MTRPQETGGMFGVANRLERERDEARAELDRIRGEFASYLELLDNGDDDLYAPWVSSRIRRILTPTLPHQEESGNADT
jgi:hypothetical protein